MSRATQSKARKNYEFLLRKWGSDLGPLSRPSTIEYYCPTIFLKWRLFVTIVPNNELSYV